MAPATAPTAKSVPPATMPSKRLLARQPIFDRERKCVAYELLARANATNAYTDVDPNLATTATVDLAMNLAGLRELTDGRRAFVNFTRDLLLQDFYEVLPPDLSVVEVLETVTPDADVVEACRRLKRRGYTIALDDFVNDPAWAPLVDLADIIKIDFMATAPAKRAAIAKWGIAKRKQMLAERVETAAEFAEADRLGYTYFQGYFFCKPELVERKQIPVNKQAYLRFLYEVSQPTIDFKRLEDVIKQEVGLSVRLLNYLNSASMGLRQRVSSIKHALTLLGQGPLRRWGSAFAVTAVAEDKPKELARLCLVRARCAELLAPDVGMAARSFDAFLTGLLSALDAMLDQPMIEALKPLPLAPDVRAALLGDGGDKFAALRGLVQSFEQADWVGVESHAASLRLSAERTGQAYTQAVTWADAFVR